jgi:hypothetical protein
MRSLGGERAEEREERGDEMRGGDKERKEQQEGGQGRQRS